jgi:hypothetical protein
VWQKAVDFQRVAVFAAAGASETAFSFGISSRAVSPQRTKGASAQAGRASR